jgi:hypothetical protein
VRLRVLRGFYTTISKRYSCIPQNGMTEGRED